MDEKGLIKQVFRLINQNYSDIYVIDIMDDKVLEFNFTPENKLAITNTFTYTDFIDKASGFVHPDDLSKYFDAISLNKLQERAVKGNKEFKIRYRKKCEAGDYRFFGNVINFLPFEGKQLIFMMSEDMNERLVDIEKKEVELKKEVQDYKKKIKEDTESIGNAIYQVNNILAEVNLTASDNLNIQATRDYINSVFSNASLDNPELNKAIVNKMVETSNYRKPSILIVDDSSIIRNSLKRIFESEYNIEIAKNGEEAVNIIKDNFENESSIKIVGVLLDLLMPVKDGFYVLDYFKNNNLFSKIPVAIISGDETKETRKKVYEYDIVDMLEKPFNTDNIRRRISKIITLYIASNDMQALLFERGKTNDSEDIKAIKTVINNIILNVLNTEESIRMKHISKIILSALSEKYDNYELDKKRIDIISNAIPLYNVGAIAMDNNMSISDRNIKQVIEYGETFINSYYKEDVSKNIATNIIKYTFEMFDGTGLPHKIKGNDIPIEAQVSNLVVRIVKASYKTSIVNVIKEIETQSKKYNPDLMDILNQVKNELKEIKY